MHRLILQLIPHLCSRICRHTWRAALLHPCRRCTRGICCSAVCCTPLFCHAIIVLLARCLLLIILDDSLQGSRTVQGGRNDCECSCVLLCWVEPA